MRVSVNFNCGQCPFEAGSLDELAAHISECDGHPAPTAPTALTAPTAPTALTAPTAPTAASAATTAYKCDLCKYKADSRDHLRIHAEINHTNASFSRFDELRRKRGRCDCS